MNFLSDKDRSILKYFFEPDPASAEKFQSFKNFFDTLDMFVAIADSGGKIRFLNKRSCELLGYKANELTGRDFVGTLVARAEQEKIASEIKRLYLKKETGSGKISYILRGKKYRKKIIDAQTIKIFDESGHPLGIFIAGKDITGITTTQKGLKKDIDLYQVILNNIPDLNIFLFDTSLVITRAEGTGLKSIGISHSDLENKPIDEIPNSRIRKIWKPLFRSIADGNTVNSEFSIGKKHFVLTGNPIENEKNEVHSCVAVIRDITEEKLTKQILKRAKEEAVKSAEAKTRFLARVSHEIRTPLNAIMGFTEQLMQTELNQKQQEYVGIIDHSSELLLSLVNDVLILSKIEANQVNFEYHPFSLKTTLRYVFNALSAKARKKGLHFKHELDPNADLVLVGDSFRLQQILMNLLDNAIKFTYEGEILLKCSLKEETADEAVLIFEVTDTGVGISPANLEYIFSPYVRKVSPHHEGTGLGLPICKNLIKLMNGRLSVSSKPGSGTTFSFTIPYRKGKDTDVPAFDNTHLDGQLLKDMKMLLVDDDSVNLLLGETLLKKLGCDYETAVNGKTAIERLVNSKFDVVLLDIHMPDISGVDVARHLRREMGDRKTKIIAMTAAALKEDIIRYQRAGIDDFIIKPFKEIYLYNKICEVMKLKKECYPKPKTDMILEGEINPKPYNLFELKKISNNDMDFIRQTLNIFLENSENAIRDFMILLNEKDWRKIGELAHKILPSYRHLEVESVVPNLVLIKTKTLIENDLQDIDQLVTETVNQIKNVTTEMQKEIE